MNKYNLEMTEWYNIKEFVNSHEKFTRKELYEYGLSTTGEQYLLLIRRVGFVNKFDIAKYERLYKIPDSLTSTKISNLVNNKLDCLKYIRKLKLINIKTLYNL